MTDVITIELFVNGCLVGNFKFADMNLTPSKLPDHPVWNLIWDRLAASARNELKTWGSEKIEQDKSANFRRS